MIELTREQQKALTEFASGLYRDQVAFQEAKRAIANLKPLPAVPGVILRPLNDVGFGTCDAEQLND